MELFNNIFRYRVLCMVNDIVKATEVIHCLNDIIYIKVCSINSEFYEVAFLYITFRSLFAFIRRKVSNLIGRVARYTPSSAYTLPSTKSRKSPRHN